ncbi:hypothetical protein CR513_48698, partial [Mucuna pruriens]
MKRVEDMCRFLLPFYDITTLISDTIWKTHCLLVENVRDKNEVIKSMVEIMMMKFYKYWDEYSVVLVTGATFDLRMKLETLGYCYKNIDPLTWEIKLEEVRKNCTSFSPNILPKVLLLFFTSIRLFASHHLELKVHKLQASSKTRRTQLNTYLDELWVILWNKWMYCGGKIIAIYF